MLLLTVWDAPVKFTVLPELLAVSVVIPEVPPIFNVELAACVNPPATPLNAVLTVNVLLFVNVTPVTVTFGIVKSPVNA